MSTMLPVLVHTPRPPHTPHRPFVPNDRATIDAFLAGHRIAFVGVSTDAKDFSRTVFRELASRGYEVVPVHPGVAEIEGRTAYARVPDIPGRLDGALIMTPAAAAEGVVRDCAFANVPRVWLHRGASGPGAVSDAAIALCHANDIAVVAGECPLMFLPSTPWFHRAHATVRIAEGHYPRAAGTPRQRAPRLVLAGYAVAVWILWAVVPVAHLAVAPVVFALAAALHARYRADASPLAVASAFAGVTAALDAIVVAGLAGGGVAVIASAMGFWVPLAVGFACALVTSTVLARWAQSR